jgi:hypothetical protein
MLANKRGKPALDWHDRELMLHWGNVNEMCAKEYSKLVADAKSH